VSVPMLSVGVVSVPSAAIDVVAFPPTASVFAEKSVVDAPPRNDSRVVVASPGNR